MTLLPAETLTEAAELLKLLERRGLTLATAESCTGGLIAGALTAIAGSSAVVMCGFVTYSNEAKQRMLGVPHAVLEGYGAVSDTVARRMAEGALEHGRVDMAVSCTGIAGPGGATRGKPVGLVHLGLAMKGRETRAVRRVFPGDRAAIRAATVAEAFRLLREAVAPAA
jgi:nicotinamide-nucleotide amidase